MTEQSMYALITGFRAVIQDNTRASTALQDAIKTVVHCPFAQRNGKPE